MNDNFHKKILKNGLTVILEKRDIPVVSVAIAVKTGGIHETKDKKGISHFIEHMLYKGTPSRNQRKIAEEIERNGGILNGFTSEVMTAYWCKMPSKHLDIALDVLSDMVKNPIFAQNELEKERKVIFEEIKMIKDNPEEYVLEEIQKLLYNEPFGQPLIGTYETMNSITREEMLKRFKTIYKPNNMILCIVGNADFDKIIHFAEENFSKSEGELPRFSIKTKNDNKTEKRKGIDQANIVFAYHSPLSEQKGDYAAEILNTLMARGMSSRLFHEIRTVRNLAYAVTGDASINKYYSFSFIRVGTTKEKIDIVKKIILEEFEEVSKNLNEKELNQVKEQIIGNHQISRESSQAQMIALLQSEVNGKAEDFYSFEKNIKDVKLKSVKDLAKNAIKKHSFFALIPED